MEESKIFSPHRKIGDVCSGKGFCVEYISGEAFVTTSIGNNFHVYKCDKLNLISVSTTVEDTISHITTTNTGFTVCSHGKHISVWKRGKMVGQLFSDDDIIIKLLCIGENIISLDILGNLTLRQLPDGIVLLQSCFPSPNNISSWCHPPTYVNKVLFGFSTGIIQLWNMQSFKMIHEFKIANEPILCLKDSPALDIIAIGVSSYIILYNIKSDNILFKYKSNLSQIIIVSFQTGLDSSLLAFCGYNTDILVLDLNKQQLVHTIPNSGFITSGIEFLINQPILLTAGSENVIKMWIFDNPDNSARLLKSRSGQSGIVKKIRFFGSFGLHLICASSSNLRYINCNRDEQSFDFSKGRKIKAWKQKGTSILNELPSIKDFSIETSKEYFWENCVTVHDSSSTAYAWSVVNKKMGKKIHPPSNAHKFATCSAITPCGNFCIIGYSSGALEVFNIQSKQHRGSFSDVPSCSSIVGVVIDGTKHMCASIDSEYCRIWIFQTQKLKSRIKLSVTPTMIEINRDSRLISISGLNKIFIIDMETSQTIRYFSIDQGTVFNDICLSSDSKWLIATGSDCCVRIWELTSSYLIDSFTTVKPIKSLTLSPNQEVLAFVLENESSIYTYTNKTLYNDDALVQVKQSSNHTKTLTKPIQSDPLCDGLLTMSLLPESRWRHLNKIDLIKERSKLKQPVKQLESAPFFIPTIPGIKPTYDVTQINIPDDNSKIKKKLSNTLLKNELDNYTNESREIFINTLLSISPTELDIQIRSLKSKSLLIFLSALYQLINDNKYFDFLQGILSLLLSIHSETFTESEFNQILKDLKELTTEKWNSINLLINQSLSITTFLRSSVTNF